ncbi:diacylglycerol/lipid kinase family protein [Demequina oxidasica]|uniref:diacylglycerol/lipid kinase family protein n=1 Tax=Demequina oxidasica TaxID=676199 RepID=UPI000785DA0D|nr:diacylglycerol kinase family protein [Demequina oxidasica]
MSRIGVITNPTAGSGRGARWGAEALTALSASGHQIRDLSRGTWAASYEAAMEHRRGLDALVVVGGDGMVHLGIQVCGERKLPLGIVAAGSGNDAAESLGLPIHDIEASVRRIHEGLSGIVARIDLGVITGATVDFPSKPRYFIAVLSAGIDAAIAAYGSNLTFPRGPLKYKVATLRELPRFKPYGVRVKVDGNEWTQRCTLVAVANGTVFGGGLKVSPDSVLNDGVLELVLAEPLSRRSILKLFPKLYDGSHLADERIRVIPATKIEITPFGDVEGGQGAALPPAFADGEQVGRAPMTVTVAPGALRVLGATLAK